MKEEELILAKILENKDSIQYKFITSVRKEWIMKMIYPDKEFEGNMTGYIKFLKEIHTDRREEELEKTIRGLVRQRMCPEAIPYLVKGRDAHTGEWVIGFPYVFMKDEKDGEMSYCNLIFSPTIETDETMIDPEIPEKYGFGILQENMHFIEGRLYKWVGRDEDGVNYFEDKDEGED